MFEDTRIEVPSSSSPYLEQVITLADKHRNTLGFLARGAFTEYAEKGSILVAVGANECVRGYLLYRTTKREVRIVHLCCDESARGRGVARLLFERLKALTKNFAGIALLCRRDYAEAIAVWRSMGLVPVAEQAGRAKEGSVLTKWWYDHGHPTLFSHANSECEQSVIPVVIDSCVFFALHDPGDLEHDEAKSLFADWLSEEIRVYASPEVLSEIHKNPDEQQREQLRRGAQEILLPTTTDQYAPILAELQSAFPDMRTGNDIADLRHVARTIAAGVKHYVTWDNGVLDLDDAIYGRFGLRILRPIELILHIDEARRESEYQPSRVAGSYRLTHRRATCSDLGRLVDTFTCNAEGETKASFSSRLRDLLDDPEQKCCYVVEDDKDDLAGMMAYGVDDVGLWIGLLRSRTARMAPTLARYLLARAVLDATNRAVRFVILAEERQEEMLASAARDVGFTRVEGEWVKVCLPGSASVQGVISSLDDSVAMAPRFKTICIYLRDRLREAGQFHATPVLSELEHLLWPARVYDVDLPTYIVAIRPAWAQNLFDERLGSHDLFGGALHLTLSSENVYYRSRRNDGGLKAPGRILWYVTKVKGYPEAGVLSACSRLTEVVVGHAKDVYKTYRRLGTYEWRDIRELKEKDAEEMIMALRFDDTVLMEEPMPWERLQSYLESAGYHSTLQSPLKIDPGLFWKIHSECMKGTNPNG